MFTMDTMEAPTPGTPGTDGDEPSHNKLEDMIKELGTALTGVIYIWGFSSFGRKERFFFYLGSFHLIPGGKYRHFSLQV